MTERMFDSTPVMAPIHYAECPHCHHEVMVRADGDCLACGKSHFDLRGVDPHLTMVAIDNVHRLPSCCFVCGQDTKRTQKMSWTHRAPTWHFPWWFAPLVGLFSFLPGSQYRQRESIRLPVCGRCAATARKARPLSIRTGLDCRLLAHRKFRQQFEQLNGREYLEWERDIDVGNAPPPSIAIGPAIKL